MIRTGSYRHAPDHLSDAVADQLRRLGAHQAVVLGEHSAVSADVMQAIESALAR